MGTFFARIVLFCSIFLPLAPLPAVALNLNYPADCPDAAQSCINQICADPNGGTLQIAAGEHSLGPVVNHPRLPPLPIENVAFGLCSNLKIKGAGINETTINANDSANPISAPVFAVGVTPPDFFREENIEVSDMTIRCESNCADEAIGMVGTDNGRIHHVRTIGFYAGIFVRTSNNITTDHNIIHGLGKNGLSRGIFYVGVAGFPPHFGIEDIDANLTSGHSVKYNAVYETSSGIDLDFALDSEITHNLIDTGGRGIRVRGADNLLLTNNLIRNMTFNYDKGFIPGGILLQSVDDSEISGNWICDSKKIPAINFRVSNLDLEIARYPEVFDNGNANNVVQFNSLLGFDKNVSFNGILFDSEVDGAISNGGGNVIKFNLAIAKAGCLID